MLISSGRFPTAGQERRHADSTAQDDRRASSGSAPWPSRPRPASAATGDHQTTLKETFSTGAAAANPVISLDAEFAVGETASRSRSRHHRLPHRRPSPLAEGVGRDAARPGRDPARDVLEQAHRLRPDHAAPRRAPDATRKGAFVRATIGIDKTLSKGIGSSTVPVVLRMANGGKLLTVRVDLKMPVAKLTALGIDSTLRSATLTLQGTIAYGAALHPITLNPSKVTVLTNAVTAQACATPTCTALRSGTPASPTSVHLPKVVSLSAPAQLNYGYRYSIGGTGQPGDHITLSVLGSDGTLLASPWGADVRPDGTFEVRATVRSGFGTDDALVRPATARYVASATEGNATVLATAANDTAVSLVTPIFHIQRKNAGSKLHLSVHVPGADTNTSVRIMLGNRTIAQGKTTAAGRFVTTDRKPDRQGQPARRRERPRRRQGDLEGDPIHPRQLIPSPTR